MANHSCPIRQVTGQLTGALHAGRISGRGTRELLERLLNIMDDISWGRAGPGVEESLRGLSNQLLAQPESGCRAIGQAVLSLLDEQQELLCSHLEAHACPTGECCPLSPAPCQAACPAQVDIPAYVALVGMGRHKEALEVLREDLPIPGSLSRICNHPCEASCSRGLVDAPIAICRLKRAAFDRACDAGLRHPAVDRSRYAERVAVVGSGPAGLSAAYFLAKKGYRPVILESMPEPGGMLMWGIPAYRLPKHILRRDIEYIQAVGVEIRTGVALGRDVTIDSLKEQGFQAVFLGLGAWAPLSLRVGGADSLGVIDGLAYLRDEKHRRIQNGKRIVVIGGGNVAVDCARTALRTGAESVQVLYRRSRCQMPAREEEVIAAEKEGARFGFLVSPLRIHTDGGKAKGIECIRNLMDDPDASGRSRLVPVEGSQHFTQADSVITAIGQTPERASVEATPGLDLNRNGIVAVNPRTMETSVPGVFAGGDLVSGPSTVIQAVVAGKIGADSLHRHLRKKPARVFGLLPKRRKQVTPEEVPTEERANPCRPPVVRIHQGKRQRTFKEVERGLTPIEAAREARRCLRCDICIRCGQCVEVCHAATGTDAIELSFVVKNASDKTDFSRTTDRCIGCSACAENCPTGAITAEQEGDFRVLRMCGAELSRNRLVSCAHCNRPVGAEKHLLVTGEKADVPIRARFPGVLCENCARKVRAEDLANRRF